MSHLLHNLPAWPWLHCTVPTAHYSLYCPGDLLILSHCSVAMPPGASFAAPVALSGPLGRHRPRVATSWHPFLLVSTSPILIAPPPHRHITYAPDVHCACPVAVFASEAFPAIATKPSLLKLQSRSSHPRPPPRSKMSPLGAATKAFPLTAPIVLPAATCTALLRRLVRDGVPCSRTSAAAAAAARAVGPGCRYPPHSLDVEEDAALFSPERAGGRVLPLPSRTRSAPILFFSG